MKTRCGFVLSSRRAPETRPARLACGISAVVATRLRLALCVRILETLSILLQKQPERGIIIADWCRAYTTAWHQLLALRPALAGITLLVIIADIHQLNWRNRNNKITIILEFSVFNRLRHRYAMA